ncbi:hypothetical protein BVRB_9g226020 [Beta vulgaris subsp. vulgaris]|uniref:Retrotransposon gag domain-containing protein n=1 Tax=Beta vulgaris subsp. vulgaris TaxID=3555 RepID=A0A0J8B5P7_BETVV|nr:hypothetical protein BVRB_9g226020 [Beta vulgaris subsp. vulgaris]
MTEFNIERPAWVRDANQRLVRNQVDHSDDLPPPEEESETTLFTMDDPKLKELYKTVENLATMVTDLSTKVNNGGGASSSAMVKSMEKRIKKHMDGATYYENLDNEISTTTKLPDKFSANDLPQFQPTDDPRFHLKAFKATLGLKGIDLALYQKIFPLSLAPICQKWSNN